MEKRGTRLAELVIRLSVAAVVASLSGALAVVQPREYESLMERIRALRQTR